MFAYVFEARAIQPWILDGGRLADVVGASELVDQITGSLIDEALKSLGLEEGKNIRISRKAGGAFYAVLKSEESARHLRDLMRLVVAAHTPGLEFIQALEAGADEREAIRKALSRLVEMRNQPVAALPVIGPLIEREARTGEAATSFLDGGRKGGHASAATVAKRFSCNADLKNLSERFIPPEKREAARWLWPRNMEHDAAPTDPYNFPFEGEDHLIGVIHADGNGLGQVLLQLNAAADEAKGLDYLRFFRDFSERIGKATLAAAQCATANVLLPAARECKGRWTLPARPIVLGGDDLSIIVRAELAIPFVEAFIDEFHQASGRELAGWFGNPDWQAAFATTAGKALRDTPSLTASAGIAFVKSNYPFELAYELAESLCKQAKQASGDVQAEGRNKPASLAFYRLTTALAEESLINTIEFGERKIALRIGSFGLEEEGRLVPLKALEKLAEVTRQHAALSTSSLRQILGVMQTDAEEAQRNYRRWREVLKDRAQDALSAFDAALAGFGTPAQDIDLPIIHMHGEKLACPLEDLFDWQAVHGKTLPQEVN